MVRSIYQPYCPVDMVQASACCFQVCLSYAVLCQVVSFHYSSNSSLHRFAGLPRNLFLPFGLQVVMRFIDLSSLSRLMCPAQDYFILVVVFITSVTAVLLSPLCLSFCHGMLY